MLTARRTCVALAAGWLLLSGVAWADVKDHADYFSKAAVDKANDQIRAIKKEFDKDVVLETFVDIPEGKKLDPDKRKEFFTAWAKENAQAGNVHGVYILICKKQGRLQIHVDPDTLKKAFTQENESNLQNMMLSRFERKKYDEALTDGVNFIEEKLKTNLKGTAPKPGPVVAANIRDEARYFSDKAIAETNGIFQDIERKHRKKVVVETYEKKLSNLQNNEWAEKRARDRNLNGILLLIYREPKEHLEVWVGVETSRRGFTPDDRTELTKLLLARFGEKKFDEGLLEAARFIDRRMDTHLGVREGNPKESDPAVPARTRGSGAATSWGGIICTLLLVVGMVWLVVAMIRAFTGGGGYGGGGGGYGGGGGFMSGLLGGLFGAMAGSWLYHNMFGGGGWGSQAYGGETGGGGGDYGADHGEGSSSGGDFGDSSGGDTGGDFGGGGGDSGGDFGGGGGDFGGGGGGDF